MYKVGFSYAHSDSRPGACHGDFCEHPESRGWTQSVISLLNDDNIGTFLSESSSLKTKVREINTAKCDLAIEIHFNSVAGGGAHGSETLYYPGSSKGRTAATIIEQHLSKAMSQASRGAKEGWYKMDRPGVIDFYGDEDGDETPDYFLKATRCTALILEPDFIQNVGHIKNRRTAGPLAIALAIREILGEDKNDRSSSSGN